MRKAIQTLVTVGLFYPCVSQAHMIGSGGGFMIGLNHPVLGFDHLLAILSVGILSAQVGGCAIWTVPATFVLVMSVGGILGMEKIRLSQSRPVSPSVLALQ